MGIIWWSFEEFHHIPKCQRKMRNTEKPKWRLLLARLAKIRYILRWELHFKDMIHTRSLTILCTVMTPTTFTPGLNSPDLGSSNDLLNSLGLSLFFYLMKEPDYVITKVLLSSKSYDPVISSGINGYHLKFSICHICSNTLILKRLLLLASLFLL